MTQEYGFCPFGSSFEALLVYSPAISDLKYDQPQYILMYVAIFYFLFGFRDFNLLAKRCIGNVVKTAWLNACNVTHGQVCWSLVASIPRCGTSMLACFSFSTNMPHSQSLRHHATLPPGTSAYLISIAAYILLSGLFYVAAVCGLEGVYGYGAPLTVPDCAVGFSGVLFAMKVSTFRQLAFARKRTPMSRLIGHRCLCPSTAPGAT